MMKNKVLILMVGIGTLIEAEQDISLKNIETFWMWIALFALALIGITILYLS